MAPADAKLEALPAELLTNIFTRLSPAEIQRSRRISKHFQAFVDDPTNTGQLVKSSIAASRQRIEQTASVLFDPCRGDDGEAYLGLLRTFFELRGLRVPRTTDTHPAFDAYPPENPDLNKELYKFYALWMKKKRATKGEFRAEQADHVYVLRMLVIMFFQRRLKYLDHHLRYSSHHYTWCDLYRLDRHRDMLSLPPSPFLSDLWDIEYDCLIPLFEEAHRIEKEGDGLPKWYVSKLWQGDVPDLISVPPANRHYALCSQSELSFNLQLPTLRLPHIFSYHTKTEWAHGKLKDLINHQLTLTPIEMAAVLEDLHIC